MPKVKRLITDRDKDEDILIQEQIGILRVKSHKTHDQIAKELRMGRDTWKRRRDNPRTFTLPELRRLRDVMAKYGLTLEVMYHDAAS